MRSQFIRLIHKAVLCLFRYQEILQLIFTAGRQVAVVYKDGRSVRRIDLSVHVNISSSLLFIC